MTRPIHQRVTLKASPKKLFDAFLDSKGHTALTGMPAKTSRRVGGRFTAFDGALSGHNLLIVPGKLIVQSWRVSNWKKRDPDSILILAFAKAPGGTRIELTHVNVPAHDHKGVTEGWRKFYWKPWKAALAKKARQGRRVDGRH